MSQLKRGGAGKYSCRITNKALEAVRIRVVLMRGYSRMGDLNVAIAEECCNADNDALSVGEQKLTECEHK